MAPGEEIVLQNDGEQTHTATADEDGLSTSRRTPARPPSRAPLPTSPATYAFHCEIHSVMTATLTVEG